MDRILAGGMWSKAGALWQLLLPGSGSANAPGGEPGRPPAPWVSGRDQSRAGNTGLYDTAPGQTSLAIAIRDESLRKSLRIALRGVTELHVQGWYASGRDLLSAADSREAPRWDAVLISDCIDDLPWHLVLKALARRSPGVRAIMLRSRTHSPQRLLEQALGVELRLDGEVQPIEWAARLQAWRRGRHGFSRSLAQQLLAIVAKPDGTSTQLESLVLRHRPLLEALAAADSPADAARHLSLGEEPFWSSVGRLREALATPECRGLLEIRARHSHHG